MGWKYKEIYTPTSKASRANGCILQHRVVAAQIIGRELTEEEVVHHKDGDKTNNKLDNLMVFKTSSDHMRFHSGQYAKLICNDGVYECTELSYDKICLYCKKNFITKDKRKIFCSKECSGLSRRIAERPTKDELLLLLKENSFVDISKKYNVTDNTIRKWCKSYNILNEIRDYKMDVVKQNKQLRVPKGIEIKKPILQYTKEGQFVKEYPSAMEAARQMGSENYMPNISRCANGKRKTANKYIWRWKA